MIRSSLTGLVFLTLCLGACQQAPLEAKQAPAKSDHKLAALPAPDPKLARVPLAERLGMEADSRPALAVRGDQLEQALKARGLSIARKRQVLASPIGASYCELSVSDQGVGVSLCEFADDASAKAGSKRSRQLFDAMIPGRTLLTQGNTLLTLTHAEGELAERQAKLIGAVFAEQTATSLQTKTALFQ